MEQAIGAIVSRLSTAERMIERLGVREQALSLVPAVRAYNDATISIATGTWTAVQLNSERFDTNGLHSTSTNSHRLTCQTAGYYAIFGNIRWAGSVTGVRGCRLIFNGTTQIAITFVPTDPGSSPVMIIVATLYQLAVGEYVEMQGYQTSGGNLNLTVDGNSSPEFSMVRVG